MCLSVVMVLFLHLPCFAGSSIFNVLFHFYLYMPVVHISFSNRKTFTLSGRLPFWRTAFIHPILFPQNTSTLVSCLHIDNYTAYYEYIMLYTYIPFPVTSLHLNVCCFLHTTHLFICTTFDSESENISHFLRQHPSLNNCTLSCLFLSVV